MMDEDQDREEILCTVNSLMAGFMLADWLYNTLLFVCEI